MSEEEKNAINTFKQGYGITDAERRVILNLIEKQQKELEQEKQKNSDLETDYILCAMDRKNHYISKDKIKEKIEQAKQKADDDNTDEYIKISAWKELLEEV